MPLPNPLHDLHAQAEAEFQPYADLEIVSTFGEPQAEYAAVRKSCALIDLPQRGILELTGKDRLSFLNNLVSNNTWDKNTKSGLAAGKGVYAFFLNLRGRIVADVNVLELGERMLVETDARIVEILRATWDKYLFVEKVTMTNRVGSLHEMALHGPGALAVLREAGGADVPELGVLDSTPVKLFDVQAVVWRDDPCAAPGYHVIVPTDSARTVWMNLLSRFSTPTETGKRALRPAGWAAFNATRIEGGRPIFDIDFPGAPPDRPGAKLKPDEAEQAASGAPSSPGAGVLPAETGQAARALSYTKCYLGQEIVARMHARGQVARMIVGVRMESDALPIAGSPVFDEARNQVGAVTSSTLSPVLSNVAICLALVKKPHFTEGTTLNIPAEGAVRKGTVVKLPFVG
ncbi:MAG: glycine cleavage T C-terminal barrel domain-containing protein [Tepidisphaeraceae bacterium]